MFEKEFDEINGKLDQVLKIHSALPEWYPLTKPFAEECGYKTIDGLRNWCLNNINPDLFIKKGKLWYVHVTALPSVKLKAG